MSNKTKNNGKVDQTSISQKIKDLSNRNYNQDMKKSSNIKIKNDL